MILIEHLNEDEQVIALDINLDLDHSEIQEVGNISRFLKLLQQQRNRKMPLVDYIKSIILISNKHKVGLTSNLQHVRLMTNVVHAMFYIHFNVGEL